MSDTIRKLTHTAAEVDDNIDEVVAARGSEESLDARLDGIEGSVTAIEESLEVGEEDDAKVLTASYSGGVGTYSWVTPSGGGGGTSDYTALTNKPQINSITLTGNKSLSDLGIAAAADIPAVPITEVQKNGSAITPVSGAVNITVPTQASDISAATAAQGTKADSALQGLKVNNSAVSPDSNKIVSITIPTSAADVSAIPTSAKGANSGVAELDATGKVPASQLPSYVDDVIEGYYYNSKFYEDSAHTTEITGTTGKIYVDLSTNKTYRWSGSGYTEISASLALGTTSSTAYRGDRGATAYTHATDSSRLTTVTSSGLYKVASTSQGHIASLAAVQKSDITALGIPAQDTTVGSGIVLTDYEKSTTGGQAVAATDTVNEAIGKIEKRVSDNESNISSVQEQANWNSNYGVKNICPYNSGTTSTGEGTVWNNLPIDIAAGTYSVSFSTDSTNSALVLLAADGATEVFRKMYSTTTVNDTFTISTAAKYIRLYIGAPKTVSNFMIHSFGDDTYQPYAMSNVELTAAIQALQAQLANQ